MAMEYVFLEISNRSFSDGRVSRQLKQFVFQVKADRVPLFKEHHAVIDESYVGIDSRCPFPSRLFPSRGARADAGPWFATLCIMNIIYFVRIGNHTVLADVLWVIIPTLAFSTPPFVEKWLAVVSHIQSHVIVPALVEFYSRVGTDMVIVVSHQALHGPCSNITTIALAVPTRFHSISFSVISLPDNINDFIKNLRILQPDNETCLVARIKFAGGHLVPISCYKSLNTIWPCICVALSFDHGPGALPFCGIFAVEKGVK
mmetsp:Transcript_22121/g.31093  ORF Transcript_22121/g.31093 Transcript_22121/m.31093 type:complete len:259 (+) Transcript_22121:134-910(+)